LRGRDGAPFEPRFEPIAHWFKDQTHPDDKLPHCCNRIPYTVALDLDLCVIYALLDVPHSVGYPTYLHANVCTGGISHNDSRGTNRATAAKSGMGRSIQLQIK